jgi:hypothetical protein
MNNGNGPNPNSGKAGAQGHIGNGFFVDGDLPPGLDDLPPGLAQLWADLMGDVPYGDSDDEPFEGGGEGEGEEGSETEGGFVFNGTPDDDEFEGTDGDERIKGGPGDDDLAGGGGDDTLEGGPGDDDLIGGAGNDILIAGPGNDTLMGGEGDDTYVFGGEIEPEEDEDEPEDEPEDESDGEPTGEDEGGEEEPPPEDGEGEAPAAAAAAAKDDNPGKGNGNGNSGKGNADDDDDENENDEDDSDDESEFEPESEDASDDEPDDDSEDDEDDSDEDDEDHSDDDEDDSDEDDDDDSDGDTGLAWGENIIEDEGGHETVVFDGEARNALAHEQHGQDLILSAGNGSLRIVGYFDDPDRWTFKDDLGEFDPTGESDEEEPAEDPGDTPETAQVIATELETEGDVGFGEDAADVFSFTAPDDGDIKIELTGLSGPSNIRVLDSEGGVIAEDGVEGDDIEHVLPVEAGATYFIEVTDGGDAGAEYGLSVEFEPDLGNTFETATPVDELDGSTSMTVGFGGDAGDFARLTPEADGTLVVEVDGGETDPILTLFSGAGDVLATGVQNEFGANRFEFDLTAGETYVVGIEPDGSPTAYDVGSSYTVAPAEEEPAVVDDASLSS